MYSAENDSLNSQVATLHDEIRNLRNLLIQHKDCPVGHQQGIGQFLAGMQDPNVAFAHQQMNPYGMAMSNGGMQAGMQRSGQYPEQAEQTSDLFGPANDVQRQPDRFEPDTAGRMTHAM